MDFDPLTASPAPGEPTFLRMPRQSSATYVANVLIGVIGGFAVIFGVSGAVRMAQDGRPVTATAYLVVAGIAAALIVGAIVRAVYRRRRYGIRTVRMAARLPAFAAANGLDLDRETTDIPISIVEDAPAYRILDRRVRNRLRPDAGDPAAPGAFELGDFHWKVDHGGGQKGIAGYAIGYVAVRLPRTLPRIVLATKAPGGSIRLAHADQILPLEGDWDQHFTLYCPAGYERDALQIMTPDVMAAMIDGASDWSAETEGDWLVFTTNRPFERAGADDYRGAFRLAEVARQFHEQAEHYSDPRVGDRTLDVVAPAGTTLRGGRNLPMIAALVSPFALVALVLLLPLFTGGR